MDKGNFTALTITMLLAAGLAASWAAARTITIDCNGPSDFNSIQEAIDDAINGDTIIVHPCIYYENINFKGKGITVTGIDPNDINIIHTTVIDANGLGNVITFDHMEDDASVLLGLTIQNGETGIYCENSGPLIEKCLVSENAGDGIYESSGQVRNCIVSGNLGIGLSNNTGHVTNCTVVGNKGHGIWIQSGPLVVSNSIIVKNSGYGLARNTWEVAGELKYNNVHNNLTGDYYGISAGTNDINQNPRFVFDGYWIDDEWVQGDYHLLSTAGRWDPNTQIWVIDDMNSPSIDAGDPLSSIGAEPSPNGAIINQGAYGGTAQASKSAGPLCTQYPAADFNKDCRVDFMDFALLAEDWLECNLIPGSACWE